MLQSNTESTMLKKKKTYPNQLRNCELKRTNEKKALQAHLHVLSILICLGPCISDPAL